MRIRFHKEGDLRWISHRDLARLWERMFRRADLPLAMSQGFHPKVKLSFPSALSLGIASTHEVLEAEMNAELAEAEVLDRLRCNAPPGLTVDEVNRVPPGQKKAQVSRMTYEIPIPEARQAATNDAIASLLARDEIWVERPERNVRVELRAGLHRLELVAGRLVITLLAGREASAHPRDVLAQLGLGDLESSGACLTRTRVELA